MISIRMFLEIGSVLALVKILNAAAEPATKDAPCEFKDTISLEGITPTADGTYVLDNGVRVPANRTGIYNTIYIGSKKISTKSHIRGCICPNKDHPCVSLCCPEGQEYNNVRCINSTEFTEPTTELNITLQNKTVIQKDIYELFTVQQNRFCEGIYEMKEYEEKSYYSLSMNGELLKFPDKRTYNKDKYCLNPTTLNRETVLAPFLCSTKNDKLKVKINAYIMLSSVPFMVITILVFLIIPDVESKLQNMSTCCYLLALSIAFCTLPAINLFENLGHGLCSVLGHVTYFAFIASYAWVSVVSYDLFVSLDTPPNKYTIWNDFTYYSIYGWGLPFLCLGIVYIFDTVDISETFKPKIGTETYCFFDDKYWNKFIYFYIPCMALISFNILMFILTIWKNNLTQISVKSSDKYGMLARLLLLTGGCWVFEISAYLFPKFILFEYTFYVVLFQGHLIFLSFILRKSVLDTISKRFRKMFPKDELRIKPRPKKQKNIQSFELKDV